jgi:hypothetical protein
MGLTNDKQHEKLVAKLESNWSLFVDLVGRVKNEKVRDSLLSLCVNLKDRMAAAPASTRLEFVGAYPGGLVENSINVLKLAKDINKVAGTEIDTDSLILVCLFHDLGKIGSQEEDYYIEQESSWHRDRGMMYEINKNLQKIHPTQRTLWWLTNAGCPLSEQEIAAISSLNHMGQMYSSELYEAPFITMVLQSAVRLTCAKSTAEKTSVIG